ncbi:MAG: hypothetical protein ABJE95_25215 [Byssovorax sp.]
MLAGDSSGRGANTPSGALYSGWLRDRAEAAAPLPVSLAPAAIPSGTTGIVDNGTGAIPPSSQTATWSQAFGAAGNDAVGGASHATSRGQSIAVDVEGNTIVAGWFTDSIDLGDGPVASQGRSDIFLLKLDPSGKRLWSRVLGGEGADRALGVAVNCDLEIVVTGWFMDDVDLGSGLVINAGGKDAFVTVFSADGEGLWSRGFGDEEDQLGNGVQVDGENNVVLTGAFGGTIDLGSGLLESAGGDDVFVAELDSEGEPRWSKRLGGDGEQIGTAVAVDGGANVIVTGTFEGRLDVGGAPVVSAGGKDVFVVKLDSLGDLAWLRRFGDGADQSGLGVAVDSAGAAVVTGEFEGRMNFASGPLESNGGKDIFVVKLDATSGHSLWGRAFGDAANQSGSGVAVIGTGDIVLTGAFEGTCDFGRTALVSKGRSDVFVAGLDRAGNHLWSERFGNAEAQFGGAVAVDESGAVVVTGGFFGSLDFGTGSLQCEGEQSAFVARLSPQ